VRGAGSDGSERFRDSLDPGNPEAVLERARRPRESAAASVTRVQDVSGALDRWPETRRGPSPDPPARPRQSMRSFRSRVSVPRRPGSRGPLAERAPSLAPDGARLTSTWRLLSSNRGGWRRFYRTGRPTCAELPFLRGAPRPGATQRQNRWGEVPALGRHGTTGTFRVSSVAKLPSSGSQNSSNQSLPSFAEAE